VISFSRAVDKTKSARDGGFPQPSFVLPPRGMTARSASFERLKTSASSLSLPGATITFGSTLATKSAGLAAWTWSGPMSAMSL